MYDILLWIGAILMLVGLLTFSFGYYFMFDPLGLFMFGSTWNMILMLLHKHGMMEDGS